MIFEEQNTFLAVDQPKPVQRPVEEETKEAPKAKVRAPKNNNSAIKRIMESLPDPELLKGL